jgi:hypothetical protein
MKGGIVSLQSHLGLVLRERDLAQGMIRFFGCKVRRRAHRDLASFSSLTIHCRPLGS